MLRRIASFALLVWLFGFVWFAVALPEPAGAGKTDGVIVVTGGGGRINRGIEVLQKGWSGKMLVAGVDREVRPKEFQAEYKVPASLMRCCITLGFESVDTRSNAQEAAHWIAKNKVSSVRLVTTDWHMRRAAFELGRMMPHNVTIIEDAVPSKPSFETLFLEYHKLMARLVFSLWGG
jgi:uncharacterized SAM-binding protein YcdF (DUF218 family)